MATVLTMPAGRRRADPAQVPDIYANDGVVIAPQGKIRAMVQPSTLARFDQLLTTLMQQEASHASTLLSLPPSETPSHASGAGR